MSARLSSGIIILARMGSTRLPGKVLLPILGVPVLEHMLRRLADVPVDRGLVVATTTNPADDVLEEFCARLGAACFRGDEDNVLARCIGAAERFGMEAVVRLGGDSPLCDRRVVTQLLEAFQAERAAGRRLDYASNTLARYLPLGLDAEVFHIDAFRRIAAIAATLGDEERRLNESNVVPYMHTHPEEFDLLQVGQGPDASQHRWTLDNPQDFELISRIYGALHPTDPDFGTAEALALIAKHPDWAAINAGVVPVSGFWTAVEREKFTKRYAAPAPNMGPGGAQ